VFLHGAWHASSFLYRKGCLTRSLATRGLRGAFAFESPVSDWPRGPAISELLLGAALGPDGDRDKAIDALGADRFAGQFVGTTTIGGPNRFRMGPFN